MKNRREAGLKRIVAMMAGLDRSGAFGCGDYDES